MQHRCVCGAHKVVQQLLLTQFTLLQINRLHCHRFVLPRPITECASVLLLRLETHGLVDLLFLS